MHRRCFLKSLAAANAPLLWTPDAFAQPAEPFQPAEGPHNPVGEGKGISPGRVVWARDAKATSWDGSSGHWWDDASTDQKAVNRMTSGLLRSLTGRRSDQQAWDALFRNFNETRKLGSSGYRRGEKIAIKINCNQDRSPQWGMAASRRPALNGLPSPQVVLSLVAQLVEAAGVPGEDILLYEVAGQRNIGEPIFNRVRSVSKGVRFLVGHDFGLGGGRLAPIPDQAHPIRFANADIPSAYLPQQVTETKYMINLALLRPHGMAGVTLIGKNHFGSLHFPNHGGWTPVPLHPYVARTQALGSYNALVDLIGHRHLGAKTLLFMLDGMYTAEHNEGNVFRFASFGDHWASSLLMSQDPVAIDSVGLDMLRSEPRATQVRGHADNYLHEAAQAGKPPSGTLYRPSTDGPALASLGVHEHWNNAADRRYSRNLGGKQGIELILAG